MRKTTNHRLVLVLLLAIFLVSGCTAIKNTMNDPVVQHCALQTIGGAVVGGVVGNTVGNSKSSQRAGAIIGSAAGGTVAFLLCRRAFNQAQEMQQRIAELEAQQQAASTSVADSGQSSDEQSSIDRGEAPALPEGDTPSGPRPSEGGRIVENLEVVDNRAIRLDLNSSLVFASGKADLQPAALGYLSILASSLEENPASQIHLLGHTDSVGSAVTNKRLSTQRAEAVAAYLIENGVDPERLETEGLGEEEPVADNSTPEGRARNRRVEVVIVPT